MAIDDRFSSNKPSEFTRNDLTGGTKLDAGPFIGKIKNNIDPAKLGRLQVYIPELASGDEDNPQNWRIVTYSSPYFGMTSQAVAGTKLNAYGTTKESYGMWMTPPDIGVLVICIFIGGDPNRGYYIGCLPDGTSHHMVPGLAGSSKYPSEQLTQEQNQKAQGANFLPVAEFNDQDSSLATSPDLNKVERPVHGLQFDAFVRQGLIGDRVRGVISSSSQRESPSNVFGISTPGRPVAYDQDNPIDVWMRQGGHSFVMDDGDVDNNDNLIRLRTSGGHQLMMNDSAGIIYLISASGRNWVEMGADGSVRVFSDADISMHATGAINFHSDAAFNVQAPNINLKAGTNINMETGGSINSFAEKNQTHVSGIKYEVKTGTLNMVGKTSTISMESNLSLVGDKILLNSGPSATVKDPAAINDIGIVPNIEPWTRPDGTVGTSEDDGVITDTPEARQNIVPKSAVVPTTGIDATKNIIAASAVQQKVSEILATQPSVSSGIGILTPVQVRVLFAGIAASESGGNYFAVNSIGYSGKYQFGVAALEDQGYVKKGTWASYGRNSVLSKDSVWAGKNGINSLNDFLNSFSVQEDIMFANASRNYTTMVRIGAIREGDDASTVAGMIKTAHLLGAGGAKNWRNGQGGQDAYGTTGEKYFTQGKSVILAYAPDGTLTA